MLPLAIIMAVILEFSDGLRLIAGYRVRLVSLALDVFCVAARCSC